jgi:hypothetical protein
MQVWVAKKWLPVVIGISVLGLGCSNGRSSLNRLARPTPSPVPVPSASVAAENPVVMPDSEVSPAVSPSVSTPSETPSPEPVGFDKRIPNLSGDARYLTYYGDWDDAKVEEAWDRRLVIGEFSKEASTAALVQKLRWGRDGIAGTEDDVTVIAYISILQERDRGEGAKLGNGEGPMQIDQARGVTGHASGYASYYVDAVTQTNGGRRTIDKSPDGEPDRVDNRTGFRVNPADVSWREEIRAYAKELLDEQGADGLFLDVLDAARPGGDYAALIPATFETVRWLHETFPRKYLIANRGFFLFESNPESELAQYNIRSYISAVMFENHYTEWSSHAERGSWSPWAGYAEETAKLVAESEKSDGFQVLVLDYVNPAQDDCQELVDRQRAAVAKDGQGKWMNFLASIDLESFGFENCKAKASTKP